MSSCVFVSDRMNRNTGCSSTSCTCSSPLSFFFNRSLKGISARIWIECDVAIEGVE